MAIDPEQAWSCGAGVADALAVYLVRARVS